MSKQNFLWPNVAKLSEWKFPFENIHFNVPATLISKQQVLYITVQQQVPDCLQQPSTQSFLLIFDYVMDVIKGPWSGHVEDISVKIFWI